MLRFFVSCSQSTAHFVIPQRNGGICCCLSNSNLLFAASHFRRHPDRSSRTPQVPTVILSAAMDPEALHQPQPTEPFHPNSRLSSFLPTITATAGHSPIQFRIQVSEDTRDGTRIGRGINTPMND